MGSNRFTRRNVMDSRHKISIPIIIASLMLTIISSVVFYNIGYSKGYDAKSRPIYVKYSNFHTQSLAVTLHDVGIFAEPAQVEELGKQMKENSKRVR